MPYFAQELIPTQPGKWFGFFACARPGAKAKSRNVVESLRIRGSGNNQFPPKWYFSAAKINILGN